MTTKPSLRTHYLSLRASAPRDAAQKIIPPALAWIGALSKTIAGYAAFRDELDIFPLMKQLSAGGHTLALPIVRDQRMRFCAWKPGDLLVAGPYGIREPMAEDCEVTPEILLVPLLAFDARGFRLGYGGGYYDRAIAQLKSASPGLRTLGIATSVQRTDQLPNEMHDTRLDAVVTEQGIEIFS